MGNPLAELAKVGQSVWYDQMERRLVSSGELQRLIDEDDLRGLTSNPTIFDKAISGSEDYDAQLRGLASQGKSAQEIYDELTIEDIGNAADVFRPVHDKTHGTDGFCSLEVSPLLARDTAGTTSEAKRLFARLGRRNVMIKIPATPEGLPAIEESIFNGVNINITLIFSNDVYAQVMEAYLRGLERRVEKNLPINEINSVASFFVSRIDAMADKQMEAKVKDDPEIEPLMGKVAIANAKMAYQEFKKVFGSERFQKLRHFGANVQRPLWASTGTKNPKYSDVLYIESLIASDTVNTIPPATYKAFKDHGRVRANAIEENLDEASNILRKFEEKGFSLKAITEKLTEEGVKSFDESFASLMSTIEARRDEVVRGLSDRLTAHLGPHQGAVDQAAQRVEKEKFVERIWKKDATLWKSDDDSKKLIANALGWLTVPELMLKNAPEIIAFANSLKGVFDNLVVLGMGGSSLCSEVTRRVFDVKRLFVLDSTVPEAVKALEERIDVSRTLFMVGSKSGNTTEPRVFHKYFYDRVRAVKGDRAGENFIAVTDPNTQLVRDAEADHFRKIFINPADIGGRYSALSYFGMVPAALAGIDVTTLLDRAVHTAHVARVASPKKNAAVMLGTIIGTMAQQGAAQGRDKLTLITPPPLDTLGLWIEQLIAESTGKEGKGVVPVAGEPALDVKDYGNDRLFVSVRLRGSDDVGRLKALADAGHPVVDLVLADPLDLGETFFVWELATAVACALLGVNAFDQPDVESSKKNTRDLLEEFKSTGKMTAGGSQVNADDAEAIGALLAKVKPGDYVALTEYFGETPARDKTLAAIRETIARELHVATTTGYGPRFLHSTGQLHKGGADNGVFLQLTGGPGTDIPIPGEPYTFGVLVRAQAIGDYQSLAARNRRLLSINLGSDVERGLETLAATVKKVFVSSRA
jgi:transaldolase/glucose-6-phosphate isomerase